MEADLLHVSIIVQLCMKIANLQSLMGYICAMGIEHHVAVSKVENADAIAEALDD